MNKLWKILVYQFHRGRHALMQIRDTPHAIAGGVALGLLFAFTPLIGLKTLLAVLAAWLFRCSKLSAALAVTFHDVLILLGPLILRWQYQIGFWIISKPHRLPPKLVKNFHFDLQNLFRMKTLHLFWPTFVGSLVFGIPIAIGSYFIVLEIVTRHQARAASSNLRKGE